MAISSKATGPTVMVLNTDVAVVTIVDPGVFVISVDTSPIVNGETLIMTVEKKVLTGSTRRVIDRFVIARHASAMPIVEDKPRESLYELAYKLRQEGGSVRTIDWHVIQLA